MKDFNTEEELNDEKIAECVESYKSTLNFLKRLEGANWIDKLYLEIKTQWNKRRPFADDDELRFLVHLMEVIEENTEE